MTDELKASKATDLLGTVTALGHLLFAHIEHTLPPADRADVVQKAIDRIRKITKPGPEHAEAINFLQLYLRSINKTDTPSA
jgi:hypothetical protein